MNYKKLLIGLAVIVGLGLFIAAAQPKQGGPSGRVLADVSANADQTASFNTSALDLAELNKLIATVNATEDSGTATVDIKIQSSPDRVTWFDTGTAFTQLTASGTETKSIVTGIFHRFIRYEVTVGGSGQYDVDLYTTGRP